MNSILNYKKLYVRYKIIKTHFFIQVLYYHIVILY